MERLTIFFIFDYLDRSGSVRSFLLISKLQFSNRFGPYLLEVRSGELWRLISPIFFHGGFLHLIFNLYWFFILSQAIEEQRSSLHFFYFILFVTIPSHIFFYFLSGPYFGGLSGLNYGLCAYLWFMERHASKFYFNLDESISNFFFIWYFVCCGLTILKIIPVANTIHSLGAFLGLVFAYIVSGQYMQIKMEIRHHPKKFFLNISKGFGVLILGIFSDLWVQFF